MQGGERALEQALLGAREVGCFATREANKNRWRLIMILVPSWPRQDLLASVVDARVLGQQQVSRAPLCRCIQHEDARLGPIEALGGGARLFLLRLEVRVLACRQGADACKVLRGRRLDEALAGRRNLVEPLC